MIDVGGPSPLGVFPSWVLGCLRKHDQQAIESKPVNSVSPLPLLQFPPRLLPRLLFMMDYNSKASARQLVCGPGIYHSNKNPASIEMLHFSGKPTENALLPFLPERREVRRVFKLCGT